LDNLSITRAQCRAGRALVEMDQNALAAAASVSRGVIIDFESGKRTPGTNNLAAIHAALERAGVEFTNGGQPGVRLSADHRSLATDAPSTLIGEDPFQGGDVQRVVTSQPRRLARRKPSE
jgi:transcriptional regulator with XRE-family HTH domain